MPAVSSSRGLQGLRVVCFESRRAVEIAELVRRQGGEPLSAPAMREVPLSENAHVFDYLGQLEAGRIDVVILMTGVGLRALVEVAVTQWPLARVTEALRRTQLVARGPKPVAALRELGLQAQLVVPEPNTWREVVAALDERLSVTGKHVVVQEYGVSNAALIDALRTRAATVMPVAIYRWALPEDLEPLRQAIAAILAGRVEVAVFTSATQVRHVFEVMAADRDRLRAALRAMVVASIGPVCTEALQDEGVEPDIQPAHGKMGHLIAAVAQQAPAALAAKRPSPP